MKKENIEEVSEQETLIVSHKWEKQEKTMPIHILDVENIYVHIDNGIIIVEKNDKTIKSYSDEEVENILIEYVKTNPTKPYRVISWFKQFKNK